jgi:hypothetical protein
LRLRYRSELAQVVSETVRAGAAPRIEILRDWGIAHAIPSGEAGAFAERALALLVTLSEGSADRYVLRPAEFHRWKEKFEPSNAEGKA